MTAASPEFPDQLDVLDEEPVMTYLMELDPTHVCKVQDKENVIWGIANGWIHSFSEDYDPHQMKCSVYEETITLDRRKIPKDIPLKPKTLEDYLKLYPIKCLDDIE